LEQGEFILHKILPFAFLSIVLVLASACTPNKQLSLTAVDKGSHVDVISGGQIIISLEGNPSTGYTWGARDLDMSMFEQVGDPVFKSNNPGLVGSSGTLTMTFNCLKAGTGTLTLIYHRPWESGVDPIDTFLLNVTIK
jgi:inhibitor of cysteine peptidase